MVALITAASPTFAGSEKAPPEAIAAIEARIAALKTEIAHHDDLYFRHAAPVISDSAYDMLKQELGRLQGSLPGADAGHAEPAVGDDRNGRFPPSAHMVPMLSLNKVYTEADLRTFCARISERVNGGAVEYAIEPKYDGVAISLTYENGQLTRAVTRGDGRVGDDVTATVRRLRDLPHALAGSTPPALVELRGEIYLTFAEFERINADRADVNEGVFANPRNLAAGTLKSLDPAVLAERELSLVLYGIGACEPASARPASQALLCEQFRVWGLPTIARRDANVANSWKGVWPAVQRLESKRPQLPYPIDGVVVKVNDASLQAKLGNASHAPEWAVAYKFSATRRATRLRDIIWQVGRTGVLTPVAELEPATLAGTVVSRATLFNADEIARLDLRRGDFVLVEKAGEIIPRIIGVDLTQRRFPETAAYVAPLQCPGCQRAVARIPGESGLYCVNPSCPPQLERQLLHFVSRKGMGIAGLGPKLISELVRTKTVGTSADLYRLRASQLEGLGNLRAVGAARVIESIAHSKRVGLARVIYALGIPGIGEGAATQVASWITQLGELPTLDFARCARTAPAGRATLTNASVDALVTFFAREEHRELILDLAGLGVGEREIGVKKTAE